MLLTDNLLFFQVVLDFHGQGIFYKHIKYSMLF